MAGELDPILDDRLTALDRNLERTVQVCDARTRELEFQQYPVDSDAWNRAFRNVRDSAQVARDRIGDLRSEIEEGLEDARGAWRQYERLYENARDVGRACVELMGGFALRDHMPIEGGYLDQRICLITEKLAARCNELTDPDLNPLSAIPAAEEALSETLTRVIRLRFPEWDVWTLPLVAYEYARVVFDDIRQLDQAIQDEVERRMEDSPDREQDDVRRMVETSMADVFGTFVMGPAYVCAAVLLRLKPSDPTHDPEREDTERAETMFAAIRGLYHDAKHPDVLSPPAQFVRDRIETRWTAALAGVDPDAPMEQIGKRASRFAARALRKVEHTTYSDARFVEYVETGEHWNRAKALSEAWQSQLTDAQVSSPPTSFGLREVLNAAWHARLLSSPTLRGDVARRAREACNLVIQEAGELRQEIANPKNRGITVGS